MSWTVIAVLILIGLLFLLLEILVIPGVGLAGIVGSILIIFAVWNSYSSHGTISGHYTVGITLFVILISLYFALKSKTWRKIMLDTNIDSKVNIVEEEKLKIGDTGITISRLAPAGKASFEGEYYEVHTNGEFIDPNTEIEIIEIDFKKIIVKPKN